jgi:hypothetical protein
LPVPLEDGQPLSERAEDGLELGVPTATESFAGHWQ